MGSVDSGAEANEQALENPGRLDRSRFVPERTRVAPSDRDAACRVPAHCPSARHGDRLAIPKSSALTRGSPEVVPDQPWSKTIRGFRVVMHDLFAMSGAERIRDVSGPREAPRERSGGAGQTLRERGALDVLEDERSLIAHVFQVVDGADVRMIQRREGPCFA